jgi:REP element-mobilizing transposase RayT
MLYLKLESENWGFPKGQTSGNRGTQSQWVLTQSQDSQVAEETKRNKDPKDLPLGFLFTPLEMTPVQRNRIRFLTGFTNEKKKMREPRIYLEGAVYYITVKAGAGELLFRDDKDYAYFLDILKERKEKYNFKLYAFCLLPNHYHLLIETKEQNISKIMQAINTSYSLYFNNRYKRQGHLMAGRFQMKVVNKDQSLLELSYYIHLNPLRVGLTKAPEEYYFSSYLEYTKDVDCAFLIDYDEIVVYLQNLLGPLEDGQSWRTRYRELIQEFAQEEPASTARKEDVEIISQAQRIVNKRKFSPRLLAGLSSGLLIILGLVLLSLRTGGHKGVYYTKELNREVSLQQKNIVSLPEGLPQVQSSEGREKQVWEFWKN